MTEVIGVSKISGKIIRTERDLLEEKYFQLKNENKELKEKIKFIYQFNMSDMVSREAQCIMIEKTFGDMFDCYGEYKNDNKRNNINDNDCYIGYSAK